MNNYYVSLILEWSGAVMGLIGAWLLSCGGKKSGFGFVFFLLSNVFLITYAIMLESYGLLIMQLGFTVTSVNGVRTWLFMSPMGECSKCRRK